MLARIDALTVLGVDAYVVNVEVDVSSNFAKFSVVGLPDMAVKESVDRVRTAIKNSGFIWPQRRITVNLAPANTRKQGPFFDLPMALGVLRGDEQCPLDYFPSFAAVGELGLDGSVRPVNGALPIALGARANGIKILLCPEANVKEAAVVDGLDVYGVTDLAQAVDLLSTGNGTPAQVDINASNLQTPQSSVDWADVKGQETVKRAMEVAAAGGHNILLVGSPGAGKTLLARRLPTILPPLSLDEALEVTKLYSVAGLIGNNQGLITERPFRAPHHTVSHAGLVGGGSHPRPGEISLAHRGVLFLDELLEFHRNVLEVLRQPMEDGEVTIARAAQSLSFPSEFQLVAAMNPCPCGFYGDQRRSCVCSPNQIRRYLGKISGPLLDRIDLHVAVPRLLPEELMSKRSGESSATVRARVCKARDIQTTRLKDVGISCNADMRNRQLQEYCEVSGAARDLLKNAIDQFGMSARAHDRILKVARTIADLENSSEIELQHIAEAINYRTLDRKLFA